MDAAQYLNDRATALVNSGEVGAAIDAFHQAITLAPGEVHVRLNLAVLLRRMGWLERSEQEAEIAARIEPREPRAHLVRGVAALGRHKYALARECFEMVVSLDPKHIDGLLNLASVLSDSNEVDGADRLFRRVLGIEPERSEALSGLATLAARRMDFDTAISLYDRARKGSYFPAAGMSMPQADAVPRWNRALALLSVGRMKDGWADFEARLWLDGGPSVPRRRFPKPVMSALPDKPIRIHVHFEQGFGDTIQFARYVPMLAALGHTVSFEVQPELVRLFRWSFPGINVVERAADYPGTYGLPEFDEHVPLMSLPGLFGTDLDTVPWGGPYLHADFDATAEWADRLKTVSTPMIGLCWAGESREDLWCKELDRRRSISLRTLLDSFPRRAERGLVSLQVGSAKAHIINIFSGFDAAPYLHDWGDTAALIANLDMVISVDTAVAHLAAAMGKPVMMLDRFDHCWRWPAEGNKTPWYPTMTIYRQEAMGDWAAPLARIGADLSKC